MVMKVIGEGKELISLDQLKQKPAYGTPCNNCGACCLNIPCGLAREVFLEYIGPDYEGPCPALWFDKDNNSRCGLYTDPLKFAHPKAPGRWNPKLLSLAVKRTNGFGFGCDQRLPDEPDAPPLYRRRIDRMNRGGMRGWVSTLVTLRHTFRWIGGTGGHFRE